MYATRSGSNDISIDAAITMQGSLPPQPADLRLACDYRGARGFTLVELLVASTIGLMVMASLATLLGLFSRTASSTQSVIDMTHRLRVVGDRLRKDLAGVTCKVAPPVSPESDSGYFELIEGPLQDTIRYDSFGKEIPNTTPNGDADDLLLFTTRSAGEPFNGKFGDATIQSATAEVGWFLQRASQQIISGLELYNLYRAQLLVQPYVGRVPFSGEDSNNNGVLNSGEDLNGNSQLDVVPNYLESPSKIDLNIKTLADARTLFDISLRQSEASSSPTIYRLDPNSLSDLTSRENRFRHEPKFPHRFALPPNFPDPMLRSPPALPINPVPLMPATFDATVRNGEDIVLRNVVAFDVRVFDPLAPIKSHPDTAVPLVPGDLGYNDAKAVASGSATGAYVDLGWGKTPPVKLAAGFEFPAAKETAFQGAGMYVSAAPDNAILGPQFVTTSSTTNFLCYDTWSTKYESNGLQDEATDNLRTAVDEGTDGVDNNNDGIPDDPAERETSPPYPVPLRGIEIRIRCIEPTTKEIRQITIRHAFDQS